MKFPKLNDVSIGLYAQEYSISELNSGLEIGLELSKGSTIVGSVA